MTDMDCIDLAKVARGLDLGLKKAMALDFLSNQLEALCKMAACFLSSEFFIINLSNSSV